MMKYLLIGASALAITAGTASAEIGPAPADNLNPYFVATNPPPGGIGTSNYSEVIQLQNDNDAEVDQTGASNASAQNFVHIQQGRTGGTSNQRNDAFVEQDGAKNKAYINQVTSVNDNTAALSGLPQRTNVGTMAAFATGNPAGANAALLGGFKQRAIIEQRNSGPSDQGNQAVIRQGVDTGTGTSGGVNNYAKIDQDGSGNRAAIQQGGGVDQEDGNMKSVIEQDGDGNRAENQQGEGDRSNIKQDGDDNQAYVNQDATLYNPGLDRYGRQSDVTQYGDDNRAYVTQHGLNGGSVVAQGTSVFNDAEDNTAYVDQQANDTFSKVVQGNREDSDDNTADVAQLTGADLAQSYIEQNGDNNYAWVRQSGARAYSEIEQGKAGDGDLNIALVQQKGADQKSYIRQGSETSGSDFNKAVVNQGPLAANAFSEVEQDGDNNNVIVNQTVANVKSYIDQDGNSNTALVNQTAVAFSVSNVIQAGNGNFALINQ